MKYIHLAQRSAAVSIITLAMVASSATAATFVPRPDRTFSDDGMAAYSVQGQQSFYNTAFSGTDIYAAGVSIDGSRTRGVLVRYDDSGRRDTQFSGDGVVLSSSREAVWWDTLVQPDGKVVVAGFDGSKHLVVARLLAGGRYDTAFSGDGMKSIDVRDPGWRVWVDIDSAGRVIVAGAAWPGDSWQSNGVVARLTPQGALDSTFAGDGVRTLDLAVTDNVASLDVDASDRPLVLISHFRPSSVEAGAHLVRLTTSGLLDKSFASDGSRLLKYQSKGGIWPLAVEQDATGLVWVGAAGATDNTLAVFRLLDDGSLDATYSSDGISSAASEMSVNFWHGGKLTESGYVFAGGKYGTGDEPQRVYLARFAPTGGLDPSFGTEGEYVTDMRTGTEYYVSVNVDAQGRLLVTGEDRTSALLGRFLTTEP